VELAIETARYFTMQKLICSNTTRVIRLINNIKKCALVL
jgi:hypothetical protein